MGKLLRDCVRQQDWVFRFGGEEFAVIARDTDAAQATMLGERIRAAFEARSRETAAGRRTCSIGIACAAPSDTAELLFVGADARLYVAKHGGRNRVVAA